MVSFTHAFPTSYWFHFHIWADVSSSSSSWTDSSSLYAVQMKSLSDRRQVLTVKTGAIPRDVTMHTAATMRLKGWKGRRSDRTAAVDLTTLCLYCLAPKSCSCFDTVALDSQVDLAFCFFYAGFTDLMWYFLEAQQPGGKPSRIFLVIFFKKNLDFLIILGNFHAQI